MLCEKACLKKVGPFLGIYQLWNSVLIKSLGNISRTWLRHKRSPWAFRVLQPPFLRVHAGVSFWSLDPLLVFNREALLCSLSEPVTHRSTKGKFLINLPEKGLIGNVSFQKSWIAAARNFTWNKLFANGPLLPRLSARLD